ncbi:hypothetical protein [Commensalibacter melissae]|uniref:hypothetical protein n=1 Tax=Commensalibacter melissae TaxID=2070537 RepID=UPI000EFC2DAA|nr:hypothetical protein [Commensalibacter melissae]AYN86297.1 hypothetical protein D9V35_01675 [Commensalibacter melissae]
MNGQTYNTNNVIPISDHHSYIGFHKKNNTSDNGNGGGGDDMEKRLSKLEAGIDFIKDKLSSHDDEFKKINDKFDKIDDKLDEINKNFNEFPTKDFMKLSISDESKSIKLWMYSIISISLPALIISLINFIISLIKLFNLQHLFH